MHVYIFIQLGTCIYTYICTHTFINVCTYQCKKNVCIYFHACICICMLVVCQLRISLFFVVIPVHKCTHVIHKPVTETLSYTYTQTCAD